MTDKIDLTGEALDVLIADIARRAPHALPILRAVRAGLVGYFELTRAGSRLLRLGPPGRLPMVALVADVEGKGPAGFATGFLQHLCTRARSVLLVCEQQDGLPYECAASHAADGGRHVLIVECPRAAIGAWVEFACACDVQQDQLAIFINEPSLPDGLEEMAIEDIPRAKRSGPVH
jgi:hypothetical protein